LSPLSAELALAVDAARAAGTILRTRPNRVERKSAADFVTDVDLRSEQRIRELLAPSGLPVQGEELGGAAQGTRWVIDPLDGTTNFVHGYPSWCVSIALVDGLAPVVGVIYDPIHDHLYTATPGSGARRNEEPIRVSDAEEVAEALFVTGFPNDFREGAPSYLRIVERVLRVSHGLRRSGSAAMDLAAVAAGQVDVFWEFRLKAWDTAAGQLLVEQAGGVVSRLDGRPHAPGDPEILACGARLHAAAVELLSRAS
jgi:myo-inositol-1(or 4)-monophosphatase